MHVCVTRIHTYMRGYVCIRSTRVESNERKGGKGREEKREAGGSRYSPRLYRVANDGTYPSVVVYRPIVGAWGRTGGGSCQPMIRIAAGCHGNKLMIRATTRRNWSGRCGRRVWRLPMAGRMRRAASGALTILVSCVRSSRRMPSRCS